MGVGSKGLGPWGDDTIMAGLIVFMAFLKGEYLKEIAFFLCRAIILSIKGWVACTH